MFKPSTLSERLAAIADKVEAQKVKIPMKHEGILEVPEGKKVNELPESHFMGLVGKRGWPAISKALINLKVWNMNRNKALSNWADEMQAKLAKKVEKGRKEKKGSFVGAISPWGKFDAADEMEQALYDVKVTLEANLDQIANNGEERLKEAGFEVDETFYNIERDGSVEMWWIVEQEGNLDKDDMEEAIQDVLGDSVDVKSAPRGMFRASISQDIDLV